MTNNENEPLLDPSEWEVLSDTLNPLLMMFDCLQSLVFYSIEIEEKLLCFLLVFLGCWVLKPLGAYIQTKQHYFKYFSIAW